MYLSELVKEEHSIDIDLFIFNKKIVKFFKKELYINISDYSDSIQSRKFVYTKIYEAPTKNFRNTPILDPKFL